MISPFTTFRRTRSDFVVIEFKFVVDRNYFKSSEMVDNMRYAIRIEGLITGCSIRPLRYLRYTLFYLCLSIQFVNAQAFRIDTLFLNYDASEITKDSLYRGVILLSGQLRTEKKDSVYNSLSKDLSSLSPATAFEFTFTFVQSGTTDNTIAAWEQCIEYISSSTPLDTVVLCKTLNYTAGGYYAKGQIDVAKEYYLQVITLVPPGKIDYELAIAHNNLGAILSNHNDPGSALSNYLRARDIFIKIIGEEHYYIGVTSNNIGQVYGKLRQYSQQIEIQEKGLEICLSTVGQYHAMTSNIYLNLGIGYMKNGQQEKSLEAFHASLKIREKLHDAAGIIAVLSEIAGFKSAFSDSCSKAEIQQTLLDVIDRGVALLDSNHAVMRNPYNNYSFFLRKQGDRDGALTYLQKAIKVSYPNFKSEGVFDMPSTIEVGDVEFTDVTLFENKGYFLYERFDSSHDIEYLLASFNTFIIGDSLIETIKSELLNGASRSRLIIIAHDYYINAIRTSIALYHMTHEKSHLNQAFAFIEKSRNWELIRHYMNSGRKDSINQNRTLQLISDLKRQLPGVYNNIPSSKTDSLNRLVDVQIEILKKEHPDYFQYLYHYSLATLETLQDFCQLNEVNWLHFFPLSQTTYSTILITPDTIAIKETTGSSDSIAYHRTELLRKMESRDWSFTQNSHTLFNLILGDYSHLLSPGKLYISSAGYLDQIPFDILLPRPAKDIDIQDLSEKYLLHDYTISLIPSGTFGLTTWDSKSMMHSSVFVAPEYADQSLHFNTVEVKVASEIMSGDYLSGHIETQEFLDLLDHTDLIHFAGHSYTHTTNLDSIFMLLGTGEDTLLIDDLLTVESSAQLAVLSSCHSATGKNSAEGNIGLAYGLAFAGTPRVISSLWSVSDRESQSIFQYFYQDLALGTNSSESLRRAKLEYLAHAPTPAQHPYFWANWVYYGHAISYKHKTSMRLYLWLTIIVLGIGGLFYWRHHSKS